MHHNEKKLTKSMCVLTAATWMSGCGRDSGSGVPTPPLPSMTFDPGTVALSKPVNAVLNPASGRFDDVSVSVTLKNVPVATFFSVIEFTKNTLDGAAVTGFTPTSLTLSLTFKPPESLAAGSYQDQVVVKLCEDAGCSEPIAGLEGTLPVNYDVTVPDAGQEPAINFSTMSFAAQSLLFDGPADRILPFSLANFGAIPYMSTSHQTSTVQFVNSNVASTTEGNLEINAESPSVLGKGVFDDVLTVTACLDIACINPVAGSPFTIQYTYTIGDTISIGGPKGYVLRAINISAEAAAWDAVSRRFYVGPSQTSAEIYSLDPETAQTSATSPLNQVPIGAMAASDDGQYLYVALLDGNIQRLTLPALANDMVFGLGQDPFGNPRYANDIAVMPGHPGTIAVAYSDYPRSHYSTGTTGSGLYDDGVARPDEASAVVNPPSGVLANDVSFSVDGSTVYGAGEAFSVAPKFYVLPVVSTGFGPATRPLDVLRGRPHAVGAKIFLVGGTVIDTASNNATQVFSPIPRTSSALPAPDVGRVFALGSDTAGPNSRLVSLDLNQYMTLASIDLPLSVATNFISGSLVRLGSNEIAFRSANFVVTITGPFVAP